MSEWQPQIVKIESIRKHPDADNLEIATVLGDYPVIVKIGDYKVGDLVSYIPIDTIVPDIAHFHFISPNLTQTHEVDGETTTVVIGKKYEVGSVPEKYRRIKAKRLRGIFSTGLITDYVFGLSEGDPIVEIFSLKKWEEQEEDNLFSNTRSGQQEAPPKGWSIPYYDIEGLRKYHKYLDPDKEYLLSEKLHGSNFSARHDGERLYVKSRNLYKKPDPNDMWVSAANRYSLEEKLIKYQDYVFFGECYGQVKNFRYDCDTSGGQAPILPKLRFFDIWDLKSLRFLDYDEFSNIILKLGLELCPLLYRGKLPEKEELYSFAEGLTTLGGKHVREGFVIRTVTEQYFERTNSRTCFKLVGEGYTLKK